MDTTVVIAGVIVGVGIGIALWRLLRRKPQKPWIETAVCPSCGWRGQISRYAGRCPSCGTAFGEQRARRPG